MDSLGNRIDLNVHTNCNVDSNNDIHCHVKFYVLNAVKKLKPDKVNEDGLLLSEIFINGSDLLFVYMCSILTKKQ